MKADGPRARPKHLRRPARRSAGEGERIFEGLGVSPGIAIGPAHVHEAGNVAVPEHTIASGEVEAERQRFRGAVEKSLRQLGKLGTKADSLPPSVSEEIGFLLEAHRQMLSQSRLVRGVERRIVEDHMNAEAAVQAEIAAITQSFAAMDDAYLAARVQDVREVGTRLIRNLTQTPFQAFKSLPEGTVVVAEEITPAVNIELPREIDLARAVEASGIGLLRTEFMFMNRDDVPQEDEQTRQLTEIVNGMGGRPVTIRTLDVGGEKLASALGSDVTPGANPALGLRAIRLGFSRPQLLQTPPASMLPAPTHGPVRTPLPVIPPASERP